MYTRPPGQLKFEKLTGTQRAVIREYMGQLFRVMDWTMPNSWSDGHWLRCKPCQKAVAFMGNEQYANINKIYGQWSNMYLVKQYYMPHAKSAEHKYNMTMSALACEK